MTDIHKAIIFDFGNVLVHWDVHRIFGRFFADPAAVDTFLAEVRYPEWNARLDAGLPFAEGVAELAGQFPHYAHILRAYDKSWLDGVTGPIHGSVDILQRLKQAGYPLYVLSNFSAEKFVHMWEQYSFVSLFDEIILSGEHHLIKPDPAFFYSALHRIGRSAQDCIFIDDHLPNIETAHSLGFNAIHFQFPEQLEMELKAQQIL
jgi:2-haloacid dehalogenase